MRGIISLPEVTVRRGGISFTKAPDIDGILASAGWCAPSDQVYNPFPEDSTPPIAWCPEWVAVEEEGTDCYLHACFHEFSGDHRVCVCGDCGATRVVLKEA